MAFDVYRFLNTTYTEAFDTKRPLMPEGTWKCYIKGVDVAPGNRPDALQLRISLIFDDDDLKAMEQFKDRDQIISNQMIFVDIDPETMAIKYTGGQNWQLGAIRAAAGQNSPGRAWNPGMLQDAGPMFVTVKHTEIKKEDPSGRKVGTGEFRDNIDKWAAA